MRYLAITALAVCLGLPTVGAAQSPSTISVQDDLFNPPQAQISSGTSLVWSNAGAAQHTITADDGSFDSGTLSPGDSFAFTFAAPGTYAYYCQIHGGPGGQGMAGAVVVGG